MLWLQYWAKGYGIHDSEAKKSCFRRTIVHTLYEQINQGLSGLETSIWDIKIIIRFFFLFLILLFNQFWLGELILVCFRQPKIYVATYLHYYYSTLLKQAK